MRSALRFHRLYHREVLQLLFLPRPAHRPRLRSLFGQLLGQQRRLHSRRILGRSRPQQCLRRLLFSHRHLLLRLLHDPPERLLLGFGRGSALSCHDRDRVLAVYLLRVQRSAHRCRMLRLLRLQHRAQCGHTPCMLHLLRLQRYLQGSRTFRMLVLRLQRRLQCSCAFRVLHFLRLQRRVHGSVAFSRSGACRRRRLQQRLHGNLVLIPHGMLRRVFLLHRLHRRRMPRLHLHPCLLRRLQ